MFVGNLKCPNEKTHVIGQIFSEMNGSRSLSETFPQYESYKTLLLNCINMRLVLQVPTQSIHITIHILHSTIYEWKTKHTLLVYTGHIISYEKQNSLNTIYFNLRFLPSNLMPIEKLLPIAKMFNWWKVNLNRYNIKCW